MKEADVLVHLISKWTLIRLEVLGWRLVAERRMHVVLLELLIPANPLLLEYGGVEAETFT